MAGAAFDVVFDLSQIKQLEQDFQGLTRVLPKVYSASVREIGLFIEREAKLRLTDQGGVDTGRLRASIGHGDDGIWKENFKPGFYVVTVGTNVEYAPYMEYGFLMATGHVAFIKGVGFRYIHPFVFKGYHYMQWAASVAQRMAPMILMRNIDKALKAYGF